MTEWTKQQRAAIETRECSLLVSAAAGSGKTAVLVERILGRVTGDGLDIDRILVVTFTKAAAAEMKERIGDALEKALARDPQNEHLQRQTTLVHHAAISTIDSFCLDVVRSHLQAVDLDPDFRVAEEGETALLEKDVLDRLLEEEYERKDEAFLRLVDNFEPQSREGELGENVLRLYAFSQAYPWPRDWRQESLDLYAKEQIAHPEQAEWLRYLVSLVRAQARDGARRLRPCCEAAAVCGKDPAKGYKETLRQDIAFLERVAAAEEYGQLYDSIWSGEAWKRIGSHAGEDEAVYERAKAVRDSVKKAFQDLAGRYVSCSLEQISRILTETAPVAGELVRLTDRFEERYARAKADRGIVDFSDIEHLALTILVDHENGDCPTQAAAEYARQYREIMIDEYQDSNQVQELLLSSISGEKHGTVHNRFMVGDVKQSIYRFRQAMPELFMEKHSTYDPGETGKDRRIELYHNFRSRAQVLEGVNLIFRQIMGPDVGGVDYDEEAALHPGREYPEGDDLSFRANELLLIPRQGEEETGEETEEPSQRSGDTPEMPQEDERQVEEDEREALAAARRIGAILEKEKVWDGKLGAYRRARCGDIAILLRTAKGQAELFARVLAREKIPVYAGGSTGYFSAPEVRTILAYLRVLDNPRQDIPLAAVLRSPLGGLSDEQIAVLRLGGAGGDLWDDLVLALESPAPDMDGTCRRRLERFMETTRGLRSQVSLIPIHELIWRILEGTGFLDYVTALPAGGQRRANLNMLVEKAIAFERGSYRGLFHFLRYIENLREYEIDYGEAPLTGEGEEAVRIMSIHKSKGLEFPIVLVCGLGRRFNDREGRGSLILHSKLGIACQLVDEQRHIRITSPVWAALGRRCLEDAQGEELRVLYVAMTRAKEKLILMGTCSPDGGLSDLKRWAEEAAGQETLLSYSLRSGAARPLDLLMPAALRHKQSAPFRREQGLEEGAFLEEDREGSGFVLRILDCQGEDDLFAPLSAPGTKGGSDRAQVFAIDPEKVYDQEMADQLQSLRSARYPFEALQDIPAKVSVSFLKAQAYEQEQERIYELCRDREEETERENEDAGGKAGAKSRRGLRAADRGTLYHLFMENLDYGQEPSDQFFERELERMVKCGKIHENDRRELKKEDFAPFFASPLFARMRRAALAGQLHREQPFVVGEKASSLRSQWDSEETVLVQGIIDAFFTEGEEVILLDYKTDAVPGGDEESLIRKYRTQLALYASALERLTGRRVTQRLIWSFALGRAVAVQ